MAALKVSGLIHRLAISPCLVVEKTLVPCRGSSHHPDGQRLHPRQQERARTMPLDLINPRLELLQKCLFEGQMEERLGSLVYDPQEVRLHEQFHGISS